MNGPEILDGINWAARQARAAIRFDVIDGLPINPFEPHLPEGMGDLWVWGEQQAADAIVTATVRGHRHVLLIERGDGHGWATPGGTLDPRETPWLAAVRELNEETGLDLSDADWKVQPVRYVPDPRAGRNAWMVTWPCLVGLGDVDELPAVVGADDARRAEWVYADDYSLLVAALSTIGGTVFQAHVDMLRELLG